MIRSQNGCSCGDRRPSEPRVDAADFFGNGGNGRRGGTNLLACAACGIADTVMTIVRGANRALCGCGRN